MPDRVQNTSCWTSLLWTAVAFLAIFPPFAVNSTSWGMRAIWIGFLLTAAFLCFMAHLREQEDPELHKYAELQRNGPYVRRYRPLAFGVILITLLVVEIPAVAATYATPDRPILWHGTELIAQWGEAIFPLIPKYATQITPPLEPQALYKVQAVMTLFLLAGALIFTIYASYIFCMPHDETQIQQRVEQAMTPSRLASSPTAMLLILVPFGVFCGFAMFLGWFEFDPQPHYLTHKKCFMQAGCYVADDLLLIATGFARICGAYGFWLGAILFALRAFASDTE